MARRCKACSHPDRTAIDRDLVRGISYRTVAGRYCLSVGTLHLHRARHLLEPTLGDILDPNGYAGWQQWDGQHWRHIPAQDLEVLVEVSEGRPGRMHNRSEDVPCGRIMGVLTRKVYRRRRTPKPLTAAVTTDREGQLLVSNRDSYDWFFVEAVLDGQYRYRGLHERYRERLPAGTSLLFPMSRFFNAQGTPFDRLGTQPLRLRISAHVKSITKNGYRKSSVTVALGQHPSNRPSASPLAER